MAQKQADQIGILKSIWTKNSAGFWIIHGIEGLDLKPRAGERNDYFRIENELKMLTKRPGPLMGNLFASFGTTEFLVRQSIVPVVAWVDGETVIRCIGTGFFISASGLLMTAAHVVRDPIDENYAKITRVAEGTSVLSDNLHFGVMLPVNPAMRTAPFIDIPPEIREAEFFICPFEWAQQWGRDVVSPLFGRKPEFVSTLDIAICKVCQNDIVGPFQPLNIGQHNLNVGDQTVAIGYAEMEDIVMGSGAQPELLVSVGSVTNIYPDNITEKQNPTPGPNFEFSAKIPGKMSGSPILVGGGFLTKGVVSRSWTGENHASGCLVAPIMHLPLDGGKMLLDLQREGTEGIAKISGPGM